MDSLNSRLRLRRRVLDMSQEELAEKARVNRATISRIESGSSVEVRTNTLARLAVALDVSTDYLLFGEAEHA